MTRAAPGPEDLRRRNLGTLLRYVHINGDTSRVELTTRLGLNRSTIGALTADLTAAGLVSEHKAPRVSGRAGRPSLMVRPESSKVYAYALNIEVDRLRAARVGLGGRILDRREAPRPRGMQAVDAIQPLAGFVRQMREAAPENARYVGAGLAIAGMVRRADGMVRLAPTIGWVDEPVGDALAEQLGDGTVAVANIADVSALVEHSRGAATGRDNVIYLYGDVGVGAGIITDGRRMTGHGGYGGEVGHMVVNPGGAECGCGSRGCCAWPGGPTVREGKPSWRSWRPRCGATGWRSGPCARSATGSASASATWPTCSTPRR
jgi:hypothetical protein